MTSRPDLASPASRAALPGAASLEGLDVQVLRPMATALGVPAASRASKQEIAAALRARLADAAFWDATLAALPELCLLALEALCEAGGALYDEQLVELLVARTGVSDELAERAVALLHERRLVLAIEFGYDDDLRDVTALLSACAEPLCARVRGASLPDPPADLDRDEAIERGERARRDVLVLTALTAHRRLRYTQSEAPDRSPLRTFTKGLGLELDEAFQRLCEARALDALEATDSGVLPRADRLLQVAREGGSIRDARTHACLPGDLWISAEAFARAARRAEVEPQLVGREGRAILAGTRSVADRIDELRRRLLFSGPCDQVRREDVDWIRRLPSGRLRPRQGDGHVTPSFEVLLGPAADLETCTIVALGAELQRIDRVLTLRLTPESVRAGLSCGLDPAQLLETLDLVGRHPVPDNVAKLVREWACGARAARVERGWSVFVDATTQRALAQGPLASFIRDAPVPGVLNVAAYTPRALLETSLAEAGWTWHATYPLEDASRQRARPTLEPDAVPPPASVRAQGLELPWSVAPGGAPEIRARISEARTRGFALPAHTCGPSAPDTEARLAELFDLTARLARECKAELTRFRTRLATADRKRLDAAQESPVLIAPFLALRPKWRRRALKQSAVLDDLLHRALDFLRGGPTRAIALGSRVVDLISDPDLAPEIDRRLRTRRASDAPAHRSSSASRARSEHVTDPVPPIPVPGASAPGRQEILDRLVRAVRRLRRVELTVDVNGTTDRVHMIAERIVVRGGHQVLLGVDLDLAEGRAVPLRDILDVRLV